MPLAQPLRDPWQNTPELWMLLRITSHNVPRPIRLVPRAFHDMNELTLERALRGMRKNSLLLGMKEHTIASPRHELETTVQTLKAPLLGIAA
jgi:hypothetical protein